MTEQQFSEFRSAREDFRTYAETLGRSLPWLRDIQEELRRKLGYEDYMVETPVVYNRALDDIGPQASPRFIFVGDNPGKNEQKACNQRYLVGQAGKLAQGWFRDNMGIDFREAGIIVNKTPIHTAKTAELSLLRRLAADRGRDLDAVLRESQERMAGFAFRFQKALGGIVWISGYGHLKGKSLFAPWAAEMARLYAGAPEPMRDNVWLFRHFSMNQFSVEYKRFKAGRGDDSAEDVCRALGVSNRKKICGW